MLFDLPGTMGSDGVIAAISALDYLFVPIKADRLVLESTLNFATTMRWGRTGSPASFTAASKPARRCCPAALSSRVTPM